MNSFDATSGNPLVRWFRSPKEPLPAGSRVRIDSELGKALFLASLSERESAPIVVVVPHAKEARDAADHLAFLRGPKLAERIHVLPAYEFDYYRGLLPNPETFFERNVALYHALNDATGRVFITSVTALLQRVLPVESFLGAVATAKRDGEVDRDRYAMQLQASGYTRQPSVQDPGTFAVRGGVVDVFSPLYEFPFRVELFGDLVEQIRFFDPKTQRSLDALVEASAVPVGACTLPSAEELPAARERLKARLDHLAVPKLRRDEILERLTDGRLQPEDALVFPDLVGGSATILDYFPAAARVVWDGKGALLDVAREEAVPRIRTSHQLYEKDPRPISERERLFLDVEGLGDAFERPGGVFVEAFSDREDIWELPSDEVSLAHERDQALQKSEGSPPLDGFTQRFRDWQDRGWRVHVVAHTRMHAERAKMLFAPHGVAMRLAPEGESSLPRLLDGDFRSVEVWQGFLGESRAFPSLGLVLLSEEELFGKKKRAGKSKSGAWGATSDATKLLASFRDLKEGDFVVHKEHGVGRYLGLKPMEFGGVSGDYVLLEYKDGDKLYVPVYRLNVLQKYVGAEAGTPIVDKLGGDRWVKAKAKAKRAVAELAAEFLELEAKRRLTPAHPCGPPNEAFQRFEMEFPYDETPDQLRAIEQVGEDLGREYAMDRLVCGDVGYGKTEVAMRAAYRLVLEGKQVAVLVPTTVLAYQHYENFRSRFRSTGARVEMVSRLRSNADIKKTMEALERGAVDIIVGTHRLLSADVKFKDLGIVIIDEEHRFGVVHKERLKKLSASVHVLSMTATPIPRTLNMALAGIKEISVISTPPPDRMSVRTFVCRSTPEVVAEAISNELARDGQVFFVHNRIETLFGKADELKRLLPKVRMEVAHGQMDGEELEKKMLAFYRGEAQVLLSTAIVESGIDVPRANTIIIDQAHHFGLAQLYQLRGRVGRADRRAYCYLLIPSESALQADAKQRLQVIQRYSELGSGFGVASHDLEIRGAGDLLGKEQSGHLTAVGVDMYFDLLEEAVEELRGRKREAEVEPEITMKIAAYFPSDYLPDVAERIAIYRKLSSVKNDDEVSAIEQEIRDRFGPPPEEVANLLGLMTLKLYLKRLHVVRMSCGPKKTALQFAPTTPASPEKLVALLTKGKGKYQLTPDQKLVFPAESNDWRSQLDGVLALSRELGVA